MSMKTILIKASILAVTAALGMALVAAPSAASAYPSCTSSYRGNVATATCAADGTAFLFSVSAKCRVDSLNGTFYKWVSGNLAAGGGLSTAKCPTAHYVVYSTVLVR
jgi:type 1 fimbria pilin